VWVVCALVLLVVAVFQGVRQHAFVNFDDGLFVARNPGLDDGLSVRALIEIFTQPFFANWIPMTHLSYRIDHALWGMWPGGYLLTNLALHALATCLLFAALRRMTGRDGASAFVAAVFAIHPLHVETVAWVSERKGVLAGAFWMAGLLAYARFAERPAALRYAVVLACLAAGLLSKPTFVTFPIVLLLLDHWPLRRLSRRTLWEKLPMLALAALGAALEFRAQHAFGAMTFAETRGLTLGLRICNALDSIVWYLAHSVWPAGLTAFYPYPLDELSVERALVQGAALVGVTGLLLRAGRQQPALAVGWLWFLVTLAPTLGVVQVGAQARADRYMYLPLVGLLIALAYPVAAWMQQRSRGLRSGLAGAALVCVALLAGAAWRQVGTWRDTETLFARNVALEPASAVGHGTLATELVTQERFEEAEPHLEAAFRLSPRENREALLLFHLLVGSRLAKSGDDAGALARYERALALDPEHPDANATLGAALARGGRGAQALAYLERAIASGKAPAIAYAALADVRAASGRPADAVLAGREALRRNPDLGWAANNLAWLLATSPDPALRDPAEAVRVAERAATRSEAPSPDLLDTLAAAYAAAGRFDAAVETAQRAAELADRAGNPALAASIRTRLALYRSQRPYVEGG